MPRRPRVWPLKMTTSSMIRTAMGVASVCFACYYYNYYRFIHRNNRTDTKRTIHTPAKSLSLQPHAGDGKLMPLKRLNSGHEMPVLGMGTWEFGRVPDGTFNSRLIQDVLRYAIGIGYRHIDCASDYLNEHLIGDALTALMSSKQISRDQLFITSKLNQPYHAANDVRRQCLKTLRDLNCEYLDLFLIHWPFSFELPDKDFDETKRGFDADYDPWTHLKVPGVSLQETWRAMEALVDEGLVHSIGVSNFNVQLLYDLLSYARIKPAVNQIESHPYLQQRKLVQFCQFVGIDVVAYSPLGTAANKDDDAEVLLDNAVLNEIGKKYEVSAAQVALKWQLQRNVIVITKSNHMERVSENKALLHFELSDKEMQDIGALGERNVRYLQPDTWSITKDIPVFD